MSTPTPGHRRSRAATGSLVLGLVGLGTVGSSPLWFEEIYHAFDVEGIVVALTAIAGTGIAAVALGIAGIVLVRRSGGALKGLGSAITGLVLGSALGTLLTIITVWCANSGCGGFGA